MIHIEVFRVVTLYSVLVGYQCFGGLAEGRGSKVLQNIGILSQHYMVSQPRRLPLGLDWHTVAGLFDNDYKSLSDQ